MRVVPMSQRKVALMLFCLLAGVATSARAQITPFDKYLPAGYHLSTVISNFRDGGPKTTLGRELGSVGARIVNGRLVAADGRPIFFFQFSSWGNPPANYLQIIQRERQAYEALKRRGTVIVLYKTYNPI
jgi:hypothetical protein